MRLTTVVDSALVIFSVASAAYAAPVAETETTFDIARREPVEEPHIHEARGQGNSKPKTYQCPYCSAKYTSFQEAKDCSKFCKAKREIEERTLQEQGLEERDFPEVHLHEARGQGKSKPKTYQCPYCSAKYTSFQEAKDCSKFCKAKRELEARTNAIDMEERDVSEDLEVVRRGQGHSKPKTYQCPYCSAKYTSFQEAKDCSKFCKAKRELEERAMAIDAIEERDFAEPANFALVQRDVEADVIVARGQGKSKPKTYQCPYCGAKYTSFQEAKDCSLFCKAKREFADELD